MAIQSGYLLPGAELLRGKDSGFFETYKGVVETGSGKVRAYVKLIHKKALANELVCTVLAQAAGLPVANGYLVEVLRADYPESSFLASQDFETTIAFGSQDLNAPSLARQFGEDDEEAFDSLLESWSRWDEALLFDEWVANVDRHPGNFLVKGPNDVWLIDHTHAFKGPSWHLNDLLPASSTINLMAQHAQRSLTLPARHELLKLSDKLAVEFRNIAVSSLIEDSHAPRFLNDADTEAMKAFLTKRVHSLAVLVSKHVGIPRLSEMNGA